MNKKYNVCLNCQKLINTPFGYESCNCSQRKPSKEKFELGDEE